MLLKLPEGTKRLCLAISGGVDSMALAALAKSYAQTSGAVLHALHVDHRLRTSSTDEAQITYRQLQTLGIPCTILNWHHDGITTAIQERARAARYHLMDEWCAANDFPFLATAHHADDQAETVAFRIWRGAGVEGLAGMRTARKLEHCILIRPLLHVFKHQLTSITKQAQLTWVEDPSNQLMRYDRVKIRAMLAAHPDLTTRLLALGMHMQSAADRIALQLDRFFERHVTMDDTSASMQLDVYMALPLEYRHRVVARLISRYGHAKEPPRYAQLLRIAAQPPRKAELAGCMFTCEGMRLHLKALQSFDF